MEDIEKIISEMSMKDAKVLCREVMSINDTMDVLRSKWVVEILSAILYGSTRFKAIQTDVHGISEKVLTERLRQMADDHLIERTEYRGHSETAIYLCIVKKNGADGHGSIGTSMGIRLFLSFISLPHYALSGMIVGYNIYYQAVPTCTLQAGTSIYEVIQLSLFIAIPNTLRTFLASSS